MPRRLRDMSAEERASVGDEIRRLHLKGVPLAEITRTLGLARGVAWKVVNAHKARLQYARKRDEISQKRRQWRLDNLERALNQERERARRKRIRNVEKVREASRLCYLNNREIVIARVRRWQADHPEKVNEWRRTRARRQVTKAQMRALVDASKKLKNRRDMSR